MQMAVSDDHSRTCDVIAAIVTRPPFDSELPPEPRQSASSSLRWMTTAAMKSTGYASSLPTAR
jgi:hypothetical protein